MEILDIVKSILDFSVKSAEFAEEFENLKNTVKTLQILLLKLDKITKIDKDLLELLRFQLNEAKELLKKSEKPQNTMYFFLNIFLFFSWKSIKSMLPGSDLENIKEITEKLIKTSSLLTLSINVNQIALNSTKRAKTMDPIKSKDSIIKIHNSTLESATLPDIQMSDKNLFNESKKKQKIILSLNFIGEPEMLKIAEKSGINKIEVFNNKPEILIGRELFLQFPKNIITRISIFIRTLYKIKANNIF